MGNFIVAMPSFVLGTGLMPLSNLLCSRRKQARTQRTKAIDNPRRVTQDCTLTTTIYNKID